MEERSDKETVFGALGLNPQIFVNQILNSVDDVFDGAVDFFLQQGSELVDSGGGEKAETLAKGVNSIRALLKSDFDKRLGIWEKCCLQSVFGIPEDLCLPKSNESSKDLSLEVDVSDPVLDNELNSLRTKIELAGREQVELQTEMSLLEKESNFSTGFDASIAETLSIFEDNSVRETYQNILRIVPTLQTKLHEVKNQSIGGLQNKVTMNTFPTLHKRKLETKNSVSGLICSIEDPIEARDKELSPRLEQMQDILRNGHALQN